jgi:hypothetical protein
MMVTLFSSRKQYVAQNTSIAQGILHSPPPVSSHMWRDVKRSSIFHVACVVQDRHVDIIVIIEIAFSHDANNASLIQTSSLGRRMYGRIHIHGKT